MLTLLKQKFKHYFKLDKIIIMEDTMLIQLTNKKAARLLHDMEDLELIKVLQENITVPTKGKLSDKYKGIFTKEEG